MPKEVEWQTKIRKQIEKGGGYCKKWATNLTVGVPDLIAIVNGLTLFIEVKLEKEWNTNRSRTIDVTQRQKIELNDIVNSGGHGYVMVVVEYGLGKAKMRMFNPPPVSGQLICSLHDFEHFNTYDWTPQRNKDKEMFVAYLEEIYNEHPRQRS